MAVHKLMSAYLLLVAVAVAVHFMVFPLYAYDSGGEIMDAAHNVWHVLDVLMAAGLVLMMLTTWREKRRYEGDSSVDLRPWLRSNVMFYGTVLLALAFVPNWFEYAWGSNSKPIVWHVIDTALPLMFAVEAHRLWRATSV
ncbi:MAG: hypothetical protein F4Y40_11425 [Acidimicrobiia bacterium]|nr:hypothetical protein [Acidimicrobiia bacterium]MYF83343.1 hypothetical protein [Acidimicrobiia bacterium]